MNTLGHIVGDIGLIWFLQWTFDAGLNPLLSWSVVVLTILMVIMTFYAAWSDLFFDEEDVVV